MCDRLAFCILSARLNGGSGSSLANIVASRRESMQVRIHCGKLGDPGVGSLLRRFLLIPPILLVFGVSAVGRTQAPHASRPQPQLSPDSTVGLPAPANPSKADPELEQAWSLLQQGLVTEAEKSARRYLEKHTDSPDGHFFLGYILFREIQGKASSEARSGDDSRYSVSMSDATFVQTKAKASLAEYTEGAKYHDPSAFDLEVVALDYILLGDFQDADKWLTLAVQLSPEDSQAWYHLGRTKYSENQFDMAISAFSQCLKLDPKNVKAEDNLALSFEGLGRVDDALATYRTAIEWEEQAPNKNSGPYIDFGSFLIDQNRPEEAVRYLVVATDISPQDARAHEKLGKAYSQLDQLAKAQVELERAVRLAPNIASLHYVLGQVYRREGLKEKAKAELDRVAELNGTHSTPETPIP